MLLALCRRLLLEFLHTGAQCSDLVLRVFHGELLDQNGLAKDVERVRVPTECVGEKAFSVRILGLELGAVDALDKSVEKLLLLLCHRFLLPFRRLDCPDGHTQWTRERTRSFVLFIVTPTGSWMFRRSPRQGAPSERDYASKESTPAHGSFHGMMTRIMRLSRFACTAALPLLPMVLTGQDKPLPSPETLRNRAVQQIKDSEAQRERYLCRVKTETTQLDGKGGEKKVDADEREIFFVKARQIIQTVTHNGKPLTGGDAKKEIERVKKQIADAEKGKQSEFGISQSDIIRLVKLTNEKRVMVNGRPTIVFDVKGDPSAKASGMVEKAIEALEGTASIDEATGRIQDTNVRGVRDVKMAGGLFANIHKGFLLHVISAPQNDGVWLVKEVWGSGDARIGLFMHPSYRFHQVTESCRLFDVKADSVEKIEEMH